MSLANALHDATARAMRIECDLLEQMIAAFLAETGRAPVMCRNQEMTRAWLMPDDDGDIMRAAGHRDRLLDKSTRYRLKSDVLASEAVLIRDVDGLRISWRFERRVL